MVFMELIERLREERYLDSDKLTEKEELLLSGFPGVIVEDYGQGQRTYTLYGYNYK